MSSDEYRLLRLHEVLRMCKLSKSTVYRMIRAGEFPVPVKLGQRAVGWWEKDIKEWVAARPVVSR